MASYTETLNERPGEPRLPELKRKLDRAMTERGSSVFARQRLNYDTRFCRWACQSDDGRKWKAGPGRRPFPWLGATDARVPLADTYIIEDVAMLAVASQRMRVRVNSREPADPGLGHRLTNVLTWLKRDGMPEYPRERRLAASKLLERGKVVIGVVWERREQLTWQAIDLESVRVLAMRAAPGSAEAQFLELIMQPDLEEAAVEMAASYFPGVRATTLRRAIRDLRQQGHTRVPVPRIQKDAPCVVTLVPNEDIFIAPSATNLQDATDLHRPELLSETQLRERVNTHQWSSGWVERVIERQRGVINTVNAPNPQVTQPSRKDELFQVVHSFERLYDNDGVPGIYYTVWHPELLDEYAWHGLLDYEHGQYPFVFIERETIDRDLDSARGYGEIAYPLQQAIKVQLDSRTDRTSVSTLPPSFHPPSQEPEQWGPGVKIPTSDPSRYGFMEIPRYDVGSKEVEESVRRIADQYFGRMVADGVNRVFAEAIQQEMINNWAAGWQAVDTQILQLMQQFSPSTFYANPSGAAEDLMAVSRDTIQGQFGVHASYNVLYLDREVVGELINLFKEVALMDTQGLIDRSQMLQVIFEMIDPDVGERLLRHPAEARGAEIEDEKTVLTKMLAGMDEDVRPSGQAYQLRLQTLQQLLQTNPTAQRIVAQDPHVQQLLEKRFKQLGFQLQQQNNARIGLLGA